MKPGLKSRLPFKKETLEELLEETDAEETETKILGPKELARINVQDHTRKMSSLITILLLHPVF